MSENAVAQLQAPVAPPSPDKKTQVERLLCDIFSLMEFPASLDFKDASDGGLAVAVHFQGEVPGVQAGKKSALIDSVQFLVNKVVNRPNTERRWVTLGVGGFPEPRPPQGQRPPAVQAVTTPADPAGASRPSAAPPAASRRPDRGPRAPAAARPSRPSPVAIDETALEVPADPATERLGAELAEKAAKFGRHFAVLKTSPEERALLLKGSKGVGGVTVKTEGESYLRRLAFVAHKPTPMPKKNLAFPVDDDE